MPDWAVSDWAYLRNSTREVSTISGFGWHIFQHIFHVTSRLSLFVLTCTKVFIVHNKMYILHCILKIFQVWFVWFKMSPNPPSPFGCLLQDTQKLKKQCVSMKQIIGRGEMHANIHENGCTNEKINEWALFITFMDVKKTF